MKKKNGSTLKFSYKEKLEFETIDEDIIALEEELEQLDTDMMKYGSDFEKISKLSARREEVQVELDHKNERWFYLTELNEKINGDK